MRRLLVGLVAAAALVAPTAPAAADASSAVTADDLVTFDQAAAFYGKLDPGFREITHRRHVAPGWLTTPTLVCDSYRAFRGESRVTGSYYPRAAIPFILDQQLVRFSSAAEAEALLQQYRDYLAVCSGTVPLADGTTAEVQTWTPEGVGGSESLGVLETATYATEDAWLRTLVTRVGRTVSILSLTPRRGTGSAEELSALGRLAVRRLR